jgi:hypothetical protein
MDKTLLLLVEVWLLKNKKSVAVIAKPFPVKK